MQGDRETPTPLHTAKCTYDHDKLLLSYPPLQTTLTSNEGHLLLALIEGVTDKEDLISRVWGDRGLIVSDSSYYKALHTLRHYLSEVGLDRSTLKTLPRRGVVLLQHIERVCGDNSNHDVPSDLKPARPDSQTFEIATPPSEVATPLLAISDPLENSETPLAATTEEQSPPALPRSSAVFRKYFYKAFFYATFFLGITLPVYYAYMLFNKPVQLEGWRLLWETPQAKLYVERGEKKTKDSILSTMARFGSSVGATGTNYYVHKTLSELLVNCEKPESKGEALCTNHLIIEQKN